MARRLSRLTSFSSRILHEQHARNLSDFCHGRQCPRRPAAYRSWSDRNSHLHARRHGGERQGHCTGRSGCYRCPDYSRQYLSSLSSPGDELIARRGGLHEFNAWRRPILTDSGGFQVFSLEGLRKITDEGVEFRSHLDGSKHFFSPEKVISIQRNLNSDIMMQLDQCIGFGATREEARKAAELSARWARRCREAYPAGTAGNLLFGIVQGEAFAVCAKHRLPIES